MEDSESFLIERAIAGDTAATATLLQIYEPRLQHYAGRRLPFLVRGTTGPEDIVQETYYEACRLISGFTPQSSNSFYRWLLRIARFRILAAVQKYRSRRTANATTATDDSVVIDAMAQLAIYRRTPSASAAAHEFVMTVERALERLNGDYREVIQHRYLEGLTVEETAARMGRDNAKVYVLCSRALVALRTQLASVSHYR